MSSYTPSSSSSSTSTYSSVSTSESGSESESGSVWERPPLLQLRSDSSESDGRTLRTRDSPKHKRSSRTRIAATEDDYTWVGMSSSDVDSSLAERRRERKRNAGFRRGRQAQYRWKERSTTKERHGLGLLSDTITEPSEYTSTSDDTNPLNLPRYLRGPSLKGRKLRARRSPPSHSPRPSDYSTSDGSELNLPASYDVIRDDLRVLRSQLNNNSRSFLHSPILGYWQSLHNMHEMSDESRKKHIKLADDAAASPGVYHHPRTGAVLDTSGRRGGTPRRTSSRRVVVPGQSSDPYKPQIRRRKVRKSRDSRSLSQSRGSFSSHSHGHSHHGSRSHGRSLSHSHSHIHSQSGFGSSRGGRGSEVVVKRRRVRVVRTGSRTGTDHRRR